MPKCAKLQQGFWQQNSFVGFLWIYNGFASDFLVVIFLPFLFMFSFLVAVGNAGTGRGFGFLFLYLIQIKMTPFWSQTDQIDAVLISVLN